MSRTRAPHEAPLPSPRFTQDTNPEKARNIGGIGWIECAVAVVVTILLAGAPLYQMIHSANDQVFASDYPDHIRLIQQALRDGSWQPHFLFQWAVYAFSGFRSTFAALGWSMFGITLACLAGKMLLTFQCYRSAALSRVDPFLHSLRAEQLVLPLGLFSCLLMPILNPFRPQDIYLGQIAPNLWHNPTAVFAWPFAIVLFLAALQFLQHRRRRALIAVGILFLLNTIAKPNFVLAFGPVFSIACLYRFGFSRRSLAEQMILAPTVFLLAGQALWMSHAHPGAESTIVIAPLVAWRNYSRWIPLSILRSIAFPLAYIALRPDRLRDSGRLTLAWFTLGSALAWALLFAESGPRTRDFNFIWGAHLALYIVFVATIMDYLSSPARKMETFLWVLFGLHLLSGALYFLKIGVGLGYL